ncbi:MAG: choice-of-anchor B domain-containing protein [Parvicella sp.]|jgi:choice-of-anchor B domain-containing protein
MLKVQFLSLLFISMNLIGYSQLNMTEIGSLDLVTLHSSDASDIWGYVDTAGDEYAIVGLNDGTSIVDISNPTNPIEVFYEAGMNSIWRDIKTWGNYAYVTTEAQNGLLIIDMTPLGAGSTNLTTSYYFGPTGNEWQSAHNLYIDENGIAYIFGANRDEGGTIMLDLTIDPMNPVEVGIQDTYYTHDGVTRGDTLYQAHITDGFFTIYDVSDKSNPIFLGQSASPGDFTHNMWFSDDGDYVYTTDEISNGFIGEYNISDPTNIFETDKIQSSPGQNVIPHNAHFLNDYIITSYYRDGVVVHDVSNKGNMVEVANFDTSPAFSGDGFNGCWGTYPWLPSGNIITSDIENGLHVLGVTYTRGCYLEGNITDDNTSLSITQASIELISTTIAETSNVIGDYAAGIAASGTYDVVYSHPAYYSDTIFGVVLSNGIITIQDIQLVPIIPVDLIINVSDISSSIDIEGAEVLVYNDNFTFNGQTDVDGNVTFTGMVPDDYELVVGIWGYNTICTSINLPTGVNSSENIELTEGYFDDFSFDFGWTASGGAPDGIWERAEPFGTNSGPNQINPEFDASGDCLDMAYVTGNSSSGGVGADDVDIADVVLTSPVMDLSSYLSPEVNYKVWWQNVGGSGTPNDTLSVYIFDGTQEVFVRRMTQGQSDDTWQDMSFNIDHYTPVTSTMQIIFKTADWAADGGHLVEAGIDIFKVDESTGVGINEATEVPLFTIAPNPGTGVFQLQLNSISGSILVTDAVGKIVENRVIKSTTETLSISTSGIYFVRVTQNGTSQTLKLINQ